MVKIISRGELPENQEYRIQCTRCKSVLQALKSELKLMAGRYNESAYTLYCPVCNQKIWIDTPKLEDMKVK